MAWWRCRKNLMGLVAVVGAASSLLPAAMLVAQGATPRATAQSATAPLRAGLLVSPDTVAVGDPFMLRVVVEVPATATVQWPSLGDSAAMVAMRAPTRVTSELRGDRRQETAEYSLAAWRTGLLPVGLADVVVRDANGVRSVPLSDARIVVQSVLPGDTTLHVPKPARELFPRQVPWWETWLPALLVMVGLLLLWWLWRRRRIRTSIASVPPADPYDRAMQDFDRLDRMALADLGECSRAVALSTEVLRTYLSARSSRARLSCTSGELVEALQVDRRVPHARLEALLRDSDVIKFGPFASAAPRARAVQADARALVDAVERAEQAQRVAEAKAQAEADAREVSVKRADEEAARRRSRRPKVGAP